MGRLITWDQDRHFALPTDDPDHYSAVSGRITAVATGATDDGATEVVIRVRVRSFELRPNRTVGSEGGSDADEV